MKGRDIAISLIVLVILVTGAIVYKKARTNRLQVVPVSTPSIEQKIEDKFGGLKIPDNAERTELKDISGGNGYGIATRSEVLADLPETGAGYFYQVWADGQSLGKMRIAKGGWLFEGKINGQKIEIRLGEKTILEGSF